MDAGDVKQPSCVEDAKRYEHFGVPAVHEQIDQGEQGTPRPKAGISNMCG